MGWFDNEEGGNTGTTPTAGASQRPTARPAAPAASSPETGSTLGPHVQVDGTIVCGEDLTILGKVEGTIRAKGTLVVAEQADVRASIDGQRVLVHGKVEGDVHGDEKVVLGPTAHLTGDIEVSCLEIVEGAYLRGNVEMKGAKDSSPTAESAKPTGPSISKSPDVAKAAAAPGKKEGAAEATPSKSESGEGSRDEGAKNRSGPGSS